MVRTDNIKVEYNFRMARAPWGFSIVIEPDEMRLRSRYPSPTRWVGKNGYVHTEGDRWSWYRTEAKAKSEAKKRYDKYIALETAKERANELTKTLNASDDPFAVVVETPKTPSKPKPAIPLVSDYGQEEQRKRLRFGKTLIQRPEKYASGLDGSYGISDIKEPTSKNPANVLVSKLDNGTHAFCIDIDMPCELVQSRTTGHYHLYVDKIMDEAAYWKVLDALAEAGIVQDGYVRACKANGMTVLRLPPGHDTFEKLRQELAEDPGWMSVD